jgi:EamA domain-containing membrane protein RarD
MTSALLADWNNFYVITGSAAAGLTGLTFVVIALAADTKRVNAKGLRAYVTPIIVHFCAVLTLAAYLSVPHQGV